MIGKVERLAVPMATRGRLAAITILLSMFFGMGGGSTPARGQANMAAITVNKVFVNQGGQPANPPNGSAAGIQFTFTPSIAGQQGTTFTTSASGQAIGSLNAGTYVFQEQVPPGTTFVTAGASQTGGASQTLNNGGTLSVAAGGAYTITVVDQVGGQTGGGSAATLTVFKSLTTAAGQPATGTLSGYSFTLTPQSGAAQTQITNQLGQATFANLSPGVYSLAEVPASGAAFSSMTINGIAAQQGQAFQVQAGGVYNANVTNVVSGSGTITIQKQVLDQSGQPVAGASLAGYTFTISGGTGVAAATVVSSSAGQAVTSLPPGSYTIAETPSASATLLGYTINGVPTQTGAFTVGAGQTTTVVVTNRLNSTAGVGAGAGTAPLTRTINLQTGCNNVTSTYPDASASQVIANGVVPPASVDSIWRYDNIAQVFRAAYFRPIAGGIPAPVDIATINRLDAIYICVTTPATFTEPGA